MGSGSSSTPKPKVGAGAIPQSNGRDTVADVDGPSFDDPDQMRDSHMIEREGAKPRARDGRDTVADDGPSASGEHSSGLDYEDLGETEVSDEVALDQFEPPKAGDTVDGRYRLVRMLGQGATGAVFEAQHRLLGKKLALKCLHPDVATSSVAVERLFREARIAASLEHPNVVQVFDAGRDGALYYITMELLDGEPLSAFIERGGHAIGSTIDLFLAIMDGVAAVHGTGVVHRDLKPDNVIVAKRADGSALPKVLDFGVSKLYEPDPNKQLTGLGMIMGTPYYMAPEQMTDTRSVDVRADVFSLGVMLYEALGGAVPYSGESVLEIFERACEGRPVPLRQRRPEVTSAVEAVIARALCPNRDSRFESMRAMRDALAAAAQGGHDTDESNVSEPWMHGTLDGQHPLQSLEGSPTRVAEVLRRKTVPLAIQALPQRPSPVARKGSPSNTMVLWIAAGAFGVVGLGSCAFAVLWSLLS